MSNLKHEVETFCAKHSLSGRRFGEMAVGDGAFWFKLSRGRDPRETTLTKVRAFMADYDPGKNAEAGRAA